MALRDAELTKDPYQRCLQYPQPRGVAWPDAVVEAFCADDFTPILAYSSIERKIQDDRAHEVDAMFDRRLDAYFQGQLAEQAFYNSYNWNFAHSNTNVRQLINSWLEQSPGSAHAWTALGLHISTIGWESREPGYYPELSEENVQLISNLSSEAAHALEKALTLNPRIMPAYRGLMDVTRLSGPRSRIESTYQRAILIDESGYYYRYSRMHSAFRRWGGSHLEPKMLIRKAEPYVDVNPRMVNLRALEFHMKAMDHNTYEEEPSDQVAMQYLEEAVSAGPLGIAFEHGAHTADQLSDPLRAVELLSQILRFNPENHTVRRRRVRMLMQLEEHDWVLEELQHLMLMTPKHAWTQRRYAEVMIRVGNYEEAERFLWRQLAADPDNEWSLHTLVNLYIHHLRRFDKAGEATTDWVARMPESGTAWMLHSQYLKMSGKPGVHQAIQEFLRYGDESNSNQRRMMAEARQWMEENPNPGTE